MDHIIATYTVESRWPDCTNWDMLVDTSEEMVR